MVLASAKIRDFVLTDTPQLVDVSIRALNPGERKALLRLANVIEFGPDSALLRRNGRHRVGRLILPGCTVSVPPAFDPQILLGLVLYAYRLDLELAQRAKLIGVSLDARSGIDVFLQMMAAILIAEARGITSQYVAQTWEPVIAKSHNPKGRILWRADFGRHPGMGVTHVQRVKTTDNALNRLISAGVRAASGILRDSVLQGDANRQEFVWRELASDFHPGELDFDRAQLGLNRRTSHYAAGLAFSKALVLGLTPGDYFATGRDQLPALEFNVPSIFERFMERLLVEVAATNPRLGVAFQAPDRLALTDLDGNTYRSVRPDIELLVDRKPTAVVDAKFKPQYVTAQGTQKISTADIYQLLFYQARVAQRSGRVVRAAIAAAQVQVDSPPDAWPRDVVWRHEGTAEHRVSLLAIPLGALLDQLRSKPAIEALGAAPELRAFLEREWVGRAATEASASN